MDKKMEKDKKTERDKRMARKIAKAVASQGGRVYYVGGCVRDKILGIPSKDIDIEVHGVTPGALKEILSNFGKLKTQGASFGVYNLVSYDIDIAQPRKETATGRGHKDFEVSVDPFIGNRAAAKRRDFTINAMMQDVLTGKIIDPFGGLNDLKNGVIRHVNDTTFVEDPLRVFRAAQFAARFDFKIAPETAGLIKTMDTSSLSKERVYTEMEKALLKAKKPSVFFEVLKTTDQLDEWFPEVGALIGCEQDPAFHPEGDAWNHTMLVLDEAAKRRSLVSNPAHFMVSALCHDMGKPSCVSVGNDGHVHTYGHDLAGIEVARAFLNRLNPDTKLRHYVLEMVEHHMRPHSCFNNGSKIKTTNHMFDGVSYPEDLCQLAISDISGKFRSNERATLEESFLKERLDIYKKRASEPMVTGADLITLGIAPSPEFSSILKEARKAHFSGVDKPAVLKGIATKHKKSLSSLENFGESLDEMEI